MPYRTCDHLKQDGVYCSSPALRDQRFCYFHLNARARRVQAARAKLRGEPFRLHVPILDNSHAILAGIQQVLDALADNRIRAREAAVYLYGLQMAAASLKSRPEWKGSRPEIEAGEPLRALEVRSLQQQYDIPFDTDLDAPPDVAAAEINATAALPLDARPSQTEQLSLARVPVRHDPRDDASPANAVPEDREVPVPGPSRDPRASDQAPLKSPPLGAPPLSSAAADDRVGSTSPVHNTANAA